MFESQSPPLMEEDWPSAERPSLGRRARDRDTQHEYIGMSEQLSIPSPRSFGRRDDQVVRNRPPIGRRIFRTVTRFFIVALIGVGATLAWQSYGDVATDMMVARVPALGWLLPVSSMKSPGVAAVSPDPRQLLEPLASNLEVVRRSVEQFAAKQDEMAQNIAVLQAVDEDIRQKMSSTPPALPQQAASNPQPRPAQVRTQPAPVPRAPSPAGAVPR